MNCYFTFLCISTIFVSYAYGLQPIYHIADARGVKIIQQFTEYHDTNFYGVFPNALHETHLSCINSVVDWTNPESYQIKCSKNLYIATLESAFIAPSLLGTVFDAHQQFLFDITVVPGKPLFWPINFNVARKNVSRHKKIATVQGPTLFYHWVIDRLPSVLLLKDLIINDPEIKFIINASKISGYVFEYLDLLGIPKEQILVPNTDMVYYADTVYFATPFLMEPIPKKLLLELRNTLLEAARKKTTAQKYENNLIVIIQRRENDRRISNVEELSNTLKSYFPESEYQHVLYDASGPVADQIQLFNHARLVIGAMASGLTNIIYADPGTDIIEIHPTKDASSQGGEWVWWLSSAMDLNYWVLPKPFKLSDASIVVPLESLNTILQKIKERHRRNL